MELTLLGTGCAQQVPVFGCECVICAKARVQPALRRKSCSAMLRYQGETTLIDAGLPTLDQQFAAGEIQRFLLTHYHMDHVQGYFRYVGGAQMRSRSMALRILTAVTICISTQEYWLFSRH